MDENHKAEYPLPKLSDPEFRYVAIILISWTFIALLSQI